MTKKMAHYSKWFPLNPLDIIYFSKLFNMYNSLPWTPLPDTFYVKNTSERASFPRAAPLIGLIDVVIRTEVCEHQLCARV